MYTIQHIVNILQAKCQLHHADAKVDYLVTDSRRISFPSSSIFFALQTARRDGHNFIEEVYARGVRNFVVHEDFNDASFIDANFLKVKNTLLALQQLTAYHRSQFSYPVIGITGSNGKTIVKEWLYQLMSPDYNIVRSPRSYNSQIGVPLSVWQMSAANNLAIFEAGISSIDEMIHLQQVIKPTIGILTNVGQAHDEGFISQKEKLQEKWLLFNEAKTIFYPADDKDISAVASYSTTQQQALFSWGFSASSTLRITQIDKKQTSTFIQATYNNRNISIELFFTDEASIRNAITCWSVLLYYQVNDSVIAQRMHTLHPIDMRLQLIEAINGSSLINDSYSFDSNSFNVALDFLLQQQQHLHKTVILSDLPEPAGVEAYKAIAAILQAKKIDRAIAIGSTWQQHQGLLRSMVPVTEYHLSTEHFIQHFNANHFKNEAILLKGARIFGFEKIVGLLEKKVHQTVMEINLTALTHNLKQYQQQLKAGTKLMAMVKAFGYGSGSAEIAHVLQFHKVDYLAVAYVDEGVDLRKAGISLPILVLNVEEAGFENIVQYNLEPELFSFELCRSFDLFLQLQGLQQYPVHIKLDTGMHRLGFEESDMDALRSLLKDNSRMVVQSVFSHLAASEDPEEDAFTQKQVAIFERCCLHLQQTLGYAFIKHIANSAAIFRNPALQFDMVRLGIGLYGVDSSIEQQLSLQTVGTLKTTIAQLRRVKVGDTIGYNRRGKVYRDSHIATIRIGYADGFNRRMGNGVGHVFIKGKMAPVIGSVCMDMTMIDVTELDNVHAGDEVEIFGMHLPVQQVAEWCGTIAYEILTTVNQRVKRVYVEE